MPPKPKKRRPRKSEIVAQGEGLTPAQIQAAALIGTGFSVKDVAEVSGVDPRTVYRWMLDDTFRKTAAAYCDEVVRSARDRMQSLVLRAVERMSEGLDAEKPIYLKDDKGFAPVEDVPDHSQRLRASFEILDRVGLTKRAEGTTDDPFQGWLMELGARLRARDAS